MEIAEVDTPTRQAFEAWLETAEPGTAYPYFTGDLALARGSPGAIWRRATFDTADRAWKAYEDGEVELVQGRHGPNQYVYLAVKRTRTRRK